MVFLLTRNSQLNNQKLSQKKNIICSVNNVYNILGAILHEFQMYTCTERTE